MAKQFKAATVTVNLEAESSSFSRVMDEAQKKAKEMGTGVDGALTAMENKTKAFDTKVSKFLLAPFVAFGKFTSKIKNSVKNVIAPFVKLGVALKLDKVLGATTASFKKLISVAKGGFAAVSVGVAGFLALAVANTKASFEIHKLAEQNNLTYQSLNSLGLVAADTGISLEEMADVIKSLRVSVTEFALIGSGALADFFEVTGEKAGEWDMLEPQDQLLKLIETLEDLPEKQAKLYLDQLGDSAFRMAPLIAMGSEKFKELREEAEMFGSSLGDMDKLEDMNKMISRIKEVTRNFFTGFVTTLAPAVTAMFERGVALFKEKMSQLGGGDIGAGFQKFVADFTSKVAKAVGSILRVVDNVAISLVKAVDGIITLVNKAQNIPFLGGNANNISITTTARNNDIDGAKSFDEDKRKLQEIVKLQERYNDLMTKADNSEGMFGRDTEATKDFKKQAESILSYAQSLGQEMGAYGRSIDDIVDRGTRVISKKANKLNSILPERSTGALTTGAEFFDNLSQDIDKNGVTVPNRKTPKTKVSATKPVDTVGQLSPADLAAKLKAEEKLRTQALRAQLAFNNKVRDMEVGFTATLEDDKELALLKEREDYSNFYQERLDYLADIYGKESDSYLDTLAAKETAEIAFNTRQRERELASLEQRKLDREEERDLILEDILQTGNEGNALSEILNRENLDAATITDEERSQAKMQGKQAELDLEADTSNAQIKIASATGFALLSEAANHSKKAFEIQKAVRIAQATMNTYEMATGAYNALASIPYVGPALGVAAASTAVAFGLLQVKQISSQKFSGQAHDGIDFVENSGKSEGTWNLETGERVVDKRTNQDLKNYLKESNGNTNNTVGEVHAPITVYGADMNGDRIIDVLRAYPAELRDLLSSVQ